MVNEEADPRWMPVWLQLSPRRMVIGILLLVVVSLFYLHNTWPSVLSFTLPASYVSPDHKHVEHNEHVTHNRTMTNNNAFPSNGNSSRWQSSATTKPEGTRNNSRRQSSSTSPYLYPVTVHGSAAVNRTTPTTQNTPVSNLLRHQSSQSPRENNTTAAGPHVILYWTKAFDAESFNIGFGQGPFATCPYSNCEATANKSRLPQAEAVLFHGVHVGPKSVPPSRRPEQLFVFAFRESPGNFPMQRLFQLEERFFNISMSYRHSAAVYYPYSVLLVNRTEPGQVPEFQQRRRPVAWLVSHCNTTSGRELYARELQRYIDVDQYGRCGSQPALPQCQNGIMACYSAMAQSHLFYLSFENSLCEDYITEKFWLALQAGMVPVAMGATVEQYRRVAPPHSFIHVEQFSSVTALADYLHTLIANRTAYERYLAWRRSYRIGQPQPACRLCEYLQRRRPPQQITTQQLWSTDLQCRQGFQQANGFSDAPAGR